MFIFMFRFLLHFFRCSSSARWLSRCRAAVAVAELFAAAAAGDTVEVHFFLLFFSSGDSIATVMAVQSGRSPQNEGAEVRCLSRLLTHSLASHSAYISLKRSNRPHRSDPPRSRYSRGSRTGTADCPCL